MSSHPEISNAAESEQKAKKRKHDGAPKESRKKRKQLDAAPELEAVNGEDVQKSEKKKDRKKDKKHRQQITEIEKDAESSSIVNGSFQTEPSSKRSAKEVDDRDTDEVQQSPQPEERPASRKGLGEIAIDSAIELTAESSSMASGTQVKKDKKKRKREKQVEEEPIPLRTVVDTEHTSIPQDVEMTDAIPGTAGLEETTMQNQEIAEVIPETLDMETTSSFYSTRLSLYLSIPSVATANPLSGMLSLHLTPLLLTYFPPAGGVILSYYDPVLSTRPEASLNKPLAPPTGSETSDLGYMRSLTKVGDEGGACWAWLTVTFLVFKPEQGDELKGWTNVVSEGFIGIVCYNYFQTAISKARIPQGWTWTGASRSKASSRKAVKKGKLNDIDDSTQETVEESQDVFHMRADDAIDGGSGTFVDETGSQMPESTTLRVIDLEVVPAADRGKWSLQIEGTLLNETEEAEVREEERQKFEDRINRGKSRSRSRLGTPLMSGGLQGQSRGSSVLSTA